MKKRKSWIYSVFVVLIITAIILCLVFWPKNENDNNNNDNEIVEDESGNGDTDQDNDETQDESTGNFATSFSVKLPETINILLGTEVKILSGYIEIEPSDMLIDVSSEIIPRYSSSASGLEFSNSILTAKEVGSYNLKFSVPKSSTTDFTHSTLITVYEDEGNSHATQTENTLIKGIDYNLEDILHIEDNCNYNVSTDGKTIFESGKLKIISKGMSEIKVTITDNLLQYNYKFNFLVKEQPDYSITLKNINNNTIEFNLTSSSVFFINYEIKNRNEENVSQNIDVTIDDETMVSVENITAPLIKLRAHKTGTTTLTLVCVLDTSISVKITIIVK